MRKAVRAIPSLAPQARMTIDGGNLGSAAYTDSVRAVVGAKSLHHYGSLANSPAPAATDLGREQHAPQIHKSSSDEPAERRVRRGQEPLVNYRENGGGAVFSPSGGGRIAIHISRDNHRRASGRT